MDRVLTRACRFCNKRDENIYGEYCRAATYDDDKDGYGSFWRNNNCIHDQHHSFENLFEPINPTEQSELIERLKKQLERVHKEKSELIDENDKLRSLIRK